MLIVQASDDIKTIKNDINCLNGKKTEVASKEDLVFALRNNLLVRTETAELV